MFANKTVWFVISVSMVFINFIAVAINLITQYNKNSIKFDNSNIKCAKLGTNPLLEY